jgi:hypothetical protein
VVSVTDLYGCILGFLDPETHYFSENLVVPGIEQGTYGSVVRNCDH